MVQGDRPRTLGAPVHATYSRIRHVAQHLQQTVPPPRLVTPIAAADDAGRAQLSDRQRAAITSHGEAAVEELILAAMTRCGVPAVSAAIIKRGEVVWARAFGTSNVERRIPTTKQTIFALASVTKTITGVALMQLQEAGLVDLDADVSTYLPFALSHPLHPSVPITLRTLMSHTASINDTTVWMGNEAMGSGLGYAGGDPTVNLTFACREYLCPGGVYYSSKNYHCWAPTKGYAYSNVGIALVGLIVQTVSGEDFYEYCYSHVLRPLGMTTSFWRYSDMLDAGFPMDQLAMPYEYTRPWVTASTENQDLAIDSDARVDHDSADEPKVLIPLGLYGYPDTPAGNLRTSASELGRFLACFANGGCDAHGVQLLKQESVDMMMEAQFPDAPGYDGVRDKRDQGLIWHYAHGYLGHSGGDPGVSTWMGFITSGQEEGTGIVVLTNLSNDDVVSGGNGLCEQVLREYALSL